MKNNKVKKERKVSRSLAFPESLWGRLMGQAVMNKRAIAQEAIYRLEKSFEDAPTK